MTPWQLYLLFVKVGLFTFGGGYAMIPFFYDELVVNQALLGSEEFANMVALAQVTPGPVGLNSATYLGFKQFGFPGALAGTLGVATPSLTVGLAIAFFMKAFQRNRFVKAALTGIRPATLGLITAAALFLAETSIFTAPLQTMWKNFSEFGLDWRAVLIFVLTIFAEVRWKVNVLWLLLGGASMGCLLSFI